MHMMSFNLINKGMWGEIYPLQKSQMGNPKVNLNHVFFEHMSKSKAPILIIHVKQYIHI